MLILTRKLDERIVVQGDIEIAVLEIRGDQVKLGVQAPRDVKVYRKEIYEAIQTENRAALASSAAAATALPQIDLGTAK